MKYLKYKYCVQVNHGTEENPSFEDILYDVTLGWNETNEEIAKREAYNGEYEIFDDGQPEPDTTTADEVLNAMLGVNRYA